MKENNTFPDFKLQNTQEEIRTLANYAGKKVVFYFYPKDNTPGCTLEALDFSRLKETFRKYNTVIVGISKDNCQSHQKFIDKQGLTIELLSDPNALLQKALGVWKPKKFMGKEFLGTVRTTFLIDEKHNILKRWDNVKAKGHAEDVLDTALMEWSLPPL